MGRLLYVSMGIWYWKHRHWNSIDCFMADPEEETVTVRPSVQMGMQAVNHCSN